MIATETLIKETVLQEEKTVKVGDREYKFKPPTIATLTRVSAAVAKIPGLNLDAEKALAESFYMADFAKNICDAIAILILGSKGLEVEVEKKVKILGFIPFKETIIELRKEELSHYIFENIEFKELNELLSILIGGMNLAFFFGIINSLSEINLLRKTREIEMIQSGQ